MLMIVGYMSAKKAIGDFKRVGSRNHKQTFCAGQPVCMSDFVYKFSMRTI